jgi:hypothetical protein
MLNNLTEIGWEFVDWMHLAQAIDQWRALMNMVKNSIKGGGFFD